MKKRKKWIWICLAVGILILGVLIAMFYMSEKKQDTKREGTDYKIKENVKVITMDMKADNQPLAVEEHLLVFEKKQGYKIGDVIVAGIIEAAPNGFIRRVTDVKKENGIYLYETEYAVLTDVFEEVHVIRSFVMTQNGLYDMEDPKKETYMTLVATNESKLSSDTENDLLFKSEFKADLADDVTVNGEVGFDVWLEVKLDIEDEEITFGIANHTKSMGELGLSCTGELFDKEEDEGTLTKELFEKSLPNFQFAIGFVPIVITNDFQIDVQGSVQLEGEIQTKVSIESERISGFEYCSTTGEIVEINERNYTGDGLKWGVAAKASGEAKAGIYAHLVTKLYGSTGADLAVGIMGAVKGEAYLKGDSEKEISCYGSLNLSVGPEMKGNVVVSVPVIDKKLVDTPLFTLALPLFVDETWENIFIQPEVSYDNRYITNRARVHGISCPEFTFEYSDNWKISQEELESEYEWDILENERGVKINYYQSNSGFGSQFYGGDSILRYARITKVADCAFNPGYVQATDYSSLGKFIVVKLEEYAREDGRSNEGKYEIDGEIMYAVVPETYIGEKEFMGIGYWSVLSWKYSSPITVLVTSPDGTFTEQEEKEIIHILSTFQESGY